MIAAAPPFARRALALALLVAVCLALYAFAARPAWDAYRHYRESGARAAELLVRYRRLAADHDALAARLEAVRARRAAENYYLAAASPSLAAADLQNLLRAIVDDTGAELRRTQVLTARDEGALSRVAIRVQLGTDIAALRSILYALESGTPLLFIDNLDIRQRRRQQADDAAAVALEARFDLYGFTRTAAEP